MILDIKQLIIYEDRDILVCAKPAGVPVQTKKIGQMDLESFFKNEIAKKEPGKMPYLGVIHRLDQPVEGITLFAKNPQAAGKLGQQLQNNQMEKEYLAVTAGEIPAPKGTLVDWMLKDGRTNMSKVVSEKTQNAKKAELTYECLEETENKKLLRVTLKTGRHHQIRVQMAHAGMPLLGDRKYGGNLPEETGKGEPVALAAYRLSFKHPRTGKKMSFTCRPSGKAFASFPSINSRP